MGRHTRARAGARRIHLEFLFVLDQLRSKLPTLFCKMCIFFQFYVIVIIIIWLCGGLHYCVGFPVVAVNGGYSLVAVCRLLIAVASLVAEHGL